MPLIKIYLLFTFHIYVSWFIGRFLFIETPSLNERRVIEVNIAFGDKNFSNW